jgi:hypothetical protein
MKFHIKATDANGARVVKEVEAATGCDAVTAAICEGLSGVVAHPIHDPYGSADFNTRAADAHAVRLEMQSTPYWGQA